VASYQDQKTYLTSPLGGVVNGKSIIEGWLTAFEQAHRIWGIAYDIDIYICI
jgi:hypothetical protein